MITSSGDGHETAVAAAWQGAAAGATAWLIYGVVEHLVIIVLDGLHTHRYVFPSYYWKLTLFLFGIYAAAGLLAGAGAGLSVWLIRRKTCRWNSADPWIVRRACVLVSLLAAFAVNLALHIPGSGRLLFVLLVCALLTIGAILACRDAAWADRLYFAVNPWTASLLLIGPLWVMSVARLPGRLTALGAAAASTGLILLASFFVLRIARKSRSIRRSFSIPVRAAVIVVVLIGASAFADRRLFPAALARDGVASIRGRPNIIWIVLDTVRADHTSVYGYSRDTTPNLRKLASSSTVYRHAISASDFTVSSHASMFTGLLPTRHGAHYAPGIPFSQALGPESPTIAELLRGKGYLTAAVVANAGVLGTWSGINRGFQYYEPWGSMSFSGKPDFQLRRAVLPLIARFYSAELCRYSRGASDINASVFRLLGEAKAAGGPFFLFVNYMDAHHPYNAPAPFGSLYPGRNPAFRWDKYDEMAAEILTFQRGMRGPEREHMISQYDGAIAYLDSELGELFARLKRSGLYDNSLLIVTSDHGEAFGSRNLVGHTVSLYQNQVHVPLILKYPGETKPAVIDSRVSGVDIMPTILDVLGYQIPNGIDGRSLRGLESGTGRAIISECYPLERFRGIHPRFRAVRRAVYQGPWKLMVFPGGRCEFYKVARDPDEQENLFEDDPEAAGLLQAKLSSWLKSARARGVYASRPDNGTLDRLRSLGYVQ